MLEKIEPVHYIIDIAKQAMQELNIKPLIVPIRGGTDGARLSFMGLPTPNLFTGGHNFHGRYEYIPVYAMEKAINEQVKRLKRTKIDHLTANAATVEEIQRLVDAKRKLDSLYITI